MNDKLKYCITYTLRNTTLGIVNSVYKEFLTIKQLNDYIFTELCNTHSSYEIIGLYFEVLDERTIYD